MNELLSTAIEAAQNAGQLIRENFGSTLVVNEMKKHDIKLELDVRSQQLITDTLLNRFPDRANLGEESDAKGTGPI